MIPPPRVIVDTNVFISAAIKPNSPPRQIVDYIFLEQGTFLFSADTYAELNTRLQREKFDRYIDLSLRMEFLSFIISRAEWVHPVDKLPEDIQACSDPDDNKFLELAISGKADYLVTGDRELLSLGTFQGVSIVTPRQFIEL